MAFIVLGLLLTALKLLGWTFVAQWSWWIVLAPYALAAVWWTLADALGITQRNVMRREEENAERRRQERYDRLGMRMGPRRRDSREGKTGPDSRWNG